MTISDLAVERIRKSKKCIAALSYEFERGDKTIKTWLDEKDIMLTTPTAVEIIKKETDLTDSEILTETKEANASKSTVEKALP